MKLFRRRRAENKAADNSAAQETAPVEIQPAKASISLSDEHKSILGEPLDPRVERILGEIYADRAAAEKALNSRRIIEFPSNDSGERHVIQDEDGFWRIVPGPPPVESQRMIDGL